MKTFHFEITIQEEMITENRVADFLFFELIKAVIFVI